MLSEAIYLGTKFFDGKEDSKKKYARSYYAVVDSTNGHDIETFPAVYDEMVEYNDPGQFLFDDLKIGDKCKVSFGLNQGKDASGFPRRNCRLEDIL